MYYIIAFILLWALLWNFENIKKCIPWMVTILIIVFFYTLYFYLGRRDGEMISVFLLVLAFMCTTQVSKDIG